MIANIHRGLRHNTKAADFRSEPAGPLYLFVQHRICPKTAAHFSVRCTNGQSTRRCALYLLIALLPVLAVGSAHAGSVEGYWYGKGYQPLARKTMQWLTIHRSDGSFSVEFREYSDCRLVTTQREAGTWSVSGRIMTTKTRTVNARPVDDRDYYADTYEIIELDETKMRLAHEKTGKDWLLERVSEDFEFPDCKSMS